MPRRIFILKWLFLLPFALIAVRLTDLQVISRATYQAQAESQQFTEEDPALRRGNIFFQNNGDLFLAATQKEFYQLAINPDKVTDSEAVYQHLSKFVEIERDSFFRKAAREGDPFELLERRISSELRDRIAEHAPEGIVFKSEVLRYYPAEEMGAHVLGYVGPNEYGVEGRYGIEQEYEQSLQSSDGFVRRSRSGRILSWITEPIGYSSGGDDLVLTIDASAQAKAESILDDTIDEWQAEGGGVLVINPQNGKVVAMAARPNFNPNTYFEAEDVNVYINPLVQNLYEMGSVVKPLTMVAGIDRNIVREHTTYVDHGSREIDGSTIRNYDGKGRGTVDMQEVLSQSLNTGVVFVAEKLGRSAFREYFEAFGLGEATRIDLAGEVPNNLNNLNSDRFIEYATASFGQGIGVTPIGIATALSIIANGGNLVQPYVVEKVLGANGEIDETEPEIKRRVVRESSARTVTRMLVNTVDETLWEGRAQIPGYSMAAKTGTAQIPSKEARGYTDDFIHSFFGYAPAYDPEFLIFMYIEKPVGVRYASQSLTGGFRELMQFLLTNFDVVPDRI